MALTFGSLSFPACNHFGRIGIDESHPEYNEVCWFLQRSPLQHAIMAKPRMSKFLLGNFWLTCTFDASTDSIVASVLSNDEPDLSFDVEDVRSILRLPSFEEYDAFPLGNEHQQVVSVLNYLDDRQGKSSKGPGTLLRKNMGNIWNFFFAHLILCLSKKTGGPDQSPSQVTELAHALIFQRKIDFAAYFFNEMISSFSSIRRPQVPFQRLFSMLINAKLAKQLAKRDDIVYDLPLHQVGKQLLSKGANSTDNPLTHNMVAFATNARLSWGENESRRPTATTPTPTPTPRATAPKPPTKKQSVVRTPKPTPKRKPSASPPKPTKAKKVKSAPVPTPAFVLIEDLDESVQETAADAEVFTDFLFSDTTPWMRTSPVPIHEEVEEPIIEESPQRHISPRVSPPITKTKPSPTKSKSPPPKTTPLVDYSSSDDDQPPPPQAPTVSISEDVEKLHTIIGTSERLSDILKTCVGELSVTHPTLSTCLDMLHLDFLGLHSEVSDVQSEQAKLATDVAKVLDNQERILKSLSSLHSKVDKVPTSMPTVEIDTDGVFFTAEDRFLIQRLERKIGGLGSEIEGIRSLLSTPFKGSATEGEKTTTPVTDAEATKTATTIPEAPIQGEGVSTRTLEENEVEKRRNEKAKGKKPMSFAQELAELQKKKMQKHRDTDADSLRLQPASTPTPADPFELILTDAEREESIRAQLEYDQTGVLKIAEDEALKAKVADPLQAQKDELESLKKKSEAMKTVTEAKKNEEIEWFKRRMKNRKDDAKIIGATIQSPSSRSPKPLVFVKRNDNTGKAYEIEWLDVLGMSEWLEIGNSLAKSKSRLKDTVLNALRKLFIKLVNIQKRHGIAVTAIEGQRLFLIQQGLSGELIKTPKEKKKGHLASLHERGIKIDATGLNFSIPTPIAYPDSTMLSEPFGVFFEDIFGSIGFFRASEIPRAHTSFLSAILGVPPINDMGLCRMILDELKRREPSDPTNP